MRRVFKGRGKGKLTPVINLVSKMILFLIEGLIQLSIKIYEEYGNEMRKVSGGNSFY